MAVIVGSESIRAGGGMTLASFDVFVLLFECVSAYGTVGLSLGRVQSTNDSATLAGTLGPFARFVIVVLMLVGRARSVPNTIDYSFAQPELEKSVETEPIPHAAHANANVKMSAILAPLMAYLPGLNLPHAASTNDDDRGDELGPGGGGTVGGGGLKPPSSPGGLSNGGFSLLSPIVSVAGLHPLGGPPGGGSVFATPMASMIVGPPPSSSPPAVATPTSLHFAAHSPSKAAPLSTASSSTTPRSSRSSVTTTTRSRSGGVPAIVVGAAARSLESVRANTRARSPLAQYVATAELDDDDDEDEDGEGSSSPCEDQDRLVVAGRSGGTGRGGGRRRRRSSRSEPSLLAARSAVAAVASTSASVGASAGAVMEMMSPGSSVAEVDEVDDDEEEPEARVHGTNSSLGPLPSEVATTMVVPVKSVRPRSVSDGNARRGVVLPEGVRRGHRPPDECV
ncbi:hypothetical protein AMAG_20431 [Allomyces macrogynus ATCC 38327]|uniref:Uncharacterized protein n=1 Tax=Allomyces macrogynus (strain ATCC 38327) TaxID=578462 RepID=A0A0L0TB74_ALLM3|nr:hypothetical protein AMAG_20431 [Allomyces macrogynus ATCC 38327]|eukprot:KNE72043.1 hypothetical protein AMAG_20431 [Allomyces macrogynus ATCC 38327]